MSRSPVVSFAWWLCLSLCIAPSLPAHAGVMASTTRVIYIEGERDHSLMLANTNAYPVLIQAWVDNGTGDPDHARAPFVVLPAVFRLEPGARQGIRLLYNGDALPTDRESAFWLNLYEIPPAPQHDSSVAKITMAMNTQLKVFYRPKQLAMQVDRVPSQLRFTLMRENGRQYLICHNPTPYHASLTGVTLFVEGREYAVESQPDMMTRPFDKQRYVLPASTPEVMPARIRFTLLDDRGSSQQFETELSSS